MDKEAFSYSAVQGLVLHGAEACSFTSDPSIFALATLGSSQSLKWLLAEPAAEQRASVPDEESAGPVGEETEAERTAGADVARGGSSAELGQSEDLFIELSLPDDESPTGENHDRLQGGAAPTPVLRAGLQPTGEAVDTRDGRRDAASASESAGVPPPWSRWRTETGECESSGPGRRPGSARPAGLGAGADELRSPFLRLHQEILDFARFVGPTAAEAERRREAVERVEAVVKSIWPSCQVKVFGSYATGLFLPTSDIDGLKALAKALVGKSVAKSMQVIANARVPIVKFVERESEISFDISFDVTNGPDAADFILSAMQGMPPLRPLCLVIKLFLQQRGLNEVYTGGLGSYALLVMLMAHLQLHPSRRGRGAQLEANLGVLLVDFFALYSQLLNWNEVGISLRRGGCFFSKRRWGLSVAGKPFLLSIDDPQTNNNDLGRGSFRIQSVRAAFKRACALLTTASGPNSWWLLGRILRVDQVLAVRPVPHQEPSGATTLLSSGVPGTANGEGDGKGLERKGHWVSDSQGFPRSTTAEASSIEHTVRGGRGDLSGKRGFWGSVGRWLKRPAGAGNDSVPRQMNKKRKNSEEMQLPSASNRKPQGGRKASGRSGSRQGESGTSRWSGDLGSAKHKRGRGWSH